MTEEKTREFEKTRLLLAMCCLLFSVFLILIGNMPSAADEMEPETSGLYEEPSVPVVEAEETEVSNDAKEVLPEPEYAAVVVVDAGHGGQSTGTYCFEKTVAEKMINLKVIQYLKELTDSEENQDFKVYYTRTGDEYVSLKERLSLTREVSADFFISVHCNGDTSRETCGIETLYVDRDFHKKRKNSQKEKSPALKELTSRRMAEICQEELSGALGLMDRGIMERRDLYLLHHTKIPGVIVELGFMSNSKDMSVLKKSKNQKKAARAIYESMRKMCGLSEGEPKTVPEPDGTCR